MLDVLLICRNQPRQAVRANRARVGHAAAGCWTGCSSVAESCSTCTRRGHPVATLRWSAEEVAVIEHGERLRALGFVATAADRVARGCAFPQWLMQSDYLAALELDLSRHEGCLLRPPKEGPTPPITDDPYPKPIAL